MPALIERFVRAVVKALGSSVQDQSTAAEQAPARRRLPVPSEYAALHEYLDGRFATTVVLTFGQIEDLMGFPLPGPARIHREWWTADEAGSAASGPSRAWTQALRSATPNLQAQTVEFERASA